MLIKESQIFDPLKDAVILDESLNSLPLIPVVENARLGVNLVRLEDLNEDVTLEDIADYNKISVDSLAVVVDEGTAILYPDILKELPCVIEPVSEDCYESKLVDYLCNLCEENYDESYLDLLQEFKVPNIDISEDDNRMTKKQKAAINARAAGLLAGTLFTLDSDLNNARLSPYKNTQKYYNYITKHNPGRRYGNLPSNEKDAEHFFNKLKNDSGDEQFKTTNKIFDSMESLYKEAMHTPTSKLGKIIAKLRNAYHGFLLKADRAMDMKKAGFFRKMAAKILTWIDKLAAKAQLMAG